MVGFTLPMPMICDRHCNCLEADAWAKRCGHQVEHPNQRIGHVEPYGKPPALSPGARGWCGSGASDTPGTWDDTGSRW